MKTISARSLIAIAALAILGGPGIAPAQDLSREDVQTEPATTLARKFAISVDDLWYCYGFDEDTNQCTLHLGSRQSCSDLTPCAVPASDDVKTKRTEEILAFPPTSDLHFCKGFNESTNRCETYLGSRAACQSLPPCP